MNDEFKVGQRVYFPLTHGISSFGFVIAVHNDNTVSIRDDGGMKYRRLMPTVTIIKDVD